jgi:hypothetical protein
MHADKEMITLAELSTRWSMDRKTVRRLLDQAGVKCYVFGPKRNSSVRYAKDDVEKFLEKCSWRGKAIA